MKLSSIWGGGGFFDLFEAILQIVRGAGFEFRGGVNLIGLSVLWRGAKRLVGVRAMQALLEIIDSPDERARRAQSAHQRVLESFTVQPQVATIQAILRQVVQAKG